MKLHARILIVALAVALTASAGCDSMAKRMATGFNRKFNKPSWRQQVAMALDRDDADNRRTGINYMAPNTKPDDVGTLKLFALILANDRDPFVRAAAATALGMVGNADFAGPVIEALTDRSEVVRWDAARALANLVVDDAVEPLIERAVADKSANVRIAATQSLASYRKARAVRSLLQLMDARDLAVRIEAHKSLVEIYRMDLGSESKHWADIATRDIPPPLTQVELDAQKGWWRRFRDKRRRLREQNLAAQAVEDQADQEDFDRRHQAARDADAEDEQPKRSWWQRFRDEQARIRQRENPEDDEPLELGSLAPEPTEYIRPGERLPDDDKPADDQPTPPADEPDVPDKPAARPDTDPMGPTGAEADEPTVPQFPAAGDDTPQDMETVPIAAD